MLTFIIKILAIVHFVSIACLMLYGFHRLWLLVCWARIMQQPENIAEYGPLPEKLPYVTIQLPLFNERFVVERLLDATAVMAWPKNRLEIQVLDDSDDETSMIVDEKVAFWEARGINIKVMRRQNRQGYKAGAMSYGLDSAIGEFIAVFDADFIPPADFLEKTIPCFSTPATGMVQARWQFLNARHSWLTRAQALLIGHHFDIEHRVRFRKKLFFNFNGTAGVWRKTTIQDAGGWQSDTVTEDLDLSYRAQQKGWRFIYLHNYGVPSELPATLSAFRSQQQRWAMGSIQTAIKILPGLLISRLPLTVKREALFHLLANFCWIIGSVSIVTLFPAIIWRIGIGPLEIICIDIPLFLLSTGAILCYFYLYAKQISYTQTKIKTMPSLRVLIIPLLCIGLAPGIAYQIVRGGFKKGGAFVRTPKSGILGKGLMPKEAYSLDVIPNFILNIPLFLYTLMPLVFAWHRETWLAMPFLLFFPLGCFLVILCDSKELLKNLLRLKKH